MREIGELVKTVQHNCHISDAIYAGNYTVCVFLLKMRELYRWEQGLALTAAIKREDVGEWLAAREAKWDGIEGEDFAPLALAGSEHGAYDVAKINNVLAPEGYVYSGGMGLFGKPHFFIGALKRRETAEGVEIYVAGEEYARDLVAPPSMYRDGVVFIRTESLRRYLWERIEDWRFLKAKAEHPMGRAIASYDAKLLKHASEDAAEDATEAVLDRMSEAETESLILHELGEARAARLLGPGWGEMIAAHPRSKLEFYARGARDLLADSMTTLPSLIAEDNAPSLHIYFSNFSGVRKALYPALHAAYNRWAEGGPIAGLLDVVKRGEYHWRETSRMALENWETSGHDDAAVVDYIEKAAL